MTWRNPACLGLSLVTLALSSGCGGGSGVAGMDAQVDAAPSVDSGADSADADPVDAAAPVDAVVIGICDPGRVRPTNDAPIAGGDCDADSDCVDVDGGVNGRCSFIGPASHCTYDACFSDADCAAEKRCICGVGFQDANKCLADHCSACDAAECGISWSCAGPSSFGSGLSFGAPTLECHTSGDACRTDADCDASSHEFCTQKVQNDGDPVGWRCARIWCGS